MVRRSSSHWLTYYFILTVLIFWVNKSNFTCVTGSLLEGAGHVWIISSCHLTNPSWHLLWFSSCLLKITRQPRCCRYVLDLLCNSSVSYMACYTCPLRMQDNRFPHPKYKWEIRGLDCLIHRFVFIGRGCLSYAMVEAFHPIQLPQGSHPKPPNSGFFHFPPNAPCWRWQTIKRSKGNFTGCCQTLGISLSKAFLRLRKQI